MVLLGYNPFRSYLELFKSALVGRFNLGSTLERFVPIMLTAIAFTVSFKVSVFNAGVEGEVYVGAITAAWIGYSVVGLPRVLHLPLCMVLAVLAGALWAAIPGILKAYFRVNEICSTLLLNYPAIYLASYLVNNQLSSHTGIPQTPEVAGSAALAKILPPSRANTGLFIAVGILIVVYWLRHRSTLGYRMRSVGSNALYSQYIGISSRGIMIVGMLISGGIGGLAGSIEVLGIYGRYLDGFSNFVAFDGMLASLIAGNNILAIPGFAFFLAALKQGALGLERFTGIPKSMVDAIIAVFILLAAMEGFFVFRGRKKRVKTLSESASGEHDIS
jgi:simple sugar transport system permease protein